MKVVWTDTALAHLKALHAYLAKTSPDYALRWVDRLTRRSRQIGDFPLSGREVLEGPYRIIYHIKPDQIDVLALIHSARQVL